jgi:hypothetical protein
MRGDKKLGFGNKKKTVLCFDDWDALNWSCTLIYIGWGGLSLQGIV